MTGKKIGGKPTNRPSFGSALSSRSRFTSATLFRTRAPNKDPHIARAQSRIVFIVCPPIKETCKTTTEKLTTFGQVSGGIRKQRRTGGTRFDLTRRKQAA